ncbi:MAG TPA: hypothetical protein VKA94_16210 [Hyphomicrobiales bacterium]|nr:hypothetical protein [Hyphomicrobiales bacterium]
MSRYDTNLASEFFVLSSVHCLGAEASLTLGNKKSVDIFVARGKRVVTVEVKGVAGSYDWPADNIPRESRPSHFVVLVTYNGRITQPEIAPSVWVIPHKSLEPFLRQYKGRGNISRAEVRSRGARFENA